MGLLDKADDKMHEKKGEMKANFDNMGDKAELEKRRMQDRKESTDYSDSDTPMDV